MSLEYEIIRRYLSLDYKRGKLYFKKDDKVFYVDAAKGQLTKVFSNEVPFGDNFVRKLVIEIFDNKPMNPEKHIVSFGFNTFIAQNLLNSLASIPEQLGNVNLRLSVYKKKEFTKLFILLNNEKLPWKYGIDEIPKENREEFFENIFQELSSRFTGKELSATDDDLPF